MSLPNSTLRVVDLGVGMPAALVARLLANSAARVVRIEPPGGDPFYQVHPAYRLWRSQATLVDSSALDAELADADVCILGGEDYPGLPPAVDAQQLAKKYPRLVILKLTGYVEGFAPDAPAVDLLVQARTGLTYEQEADRPVCFSMALPTYGAALLGLIGIWSALLERRRSGRGQVVSTSMQQGVALFWSPLWMSASRPDAEFLKVSPKGVRHLVFQCADGGYVQFVMGIPGAVAKLYAVLGIDAPVDPNDRGNPRPGAPLDKYFGDLKLIAPYVRKRQRAELLEALWAAGIAAEPVLAPGEAWDEEQVRVNKVIQRNQADWRFVGQPVSLRSFEPERNDSSSQPTANKAGTAPLSGVRVVDLGSFVAGPYTSKLLATLGADVIKVEPISGTPGRGIVCHTIAVESSKRSIAVDMKTPEGLRIVQQLCASAAAVQHNFRVGVAPRLGVDAASLRKAKGDLAYLETTAYGSSGPKARNSGFDMVMQALCGHEVRAGGEGNPPLWYRVPLIDYGTGALGAAALLTALFRSDAEGVGVEAEVSLLNTALFLMSELVQRPDGRFVGGELLDTRQSGFHPAESLYQTRDGWIAVAARTEEMARRFAEVLGLSDLGSRADWGDTQRKRIAENVRQRETQSLIDQLRQAGVWAERCVENGWTQLRDSPAARAAHLVVQLPDARYEQVEGCHGALINFSRSQPPVGNLRSAPAPGEHTDELLRELGYSVDEISDLRHRKIVA